MNQINTRQVSKVPTDPDNVYLDLIVTNLKSSTTAPVAINFNENRNSPVINNTGRYNLSIVRFSLETQTLPVFIPVIQPNQGDRNLTIYSVTLQVPSVVTPGVVYTEQTFVEWIPQNSTAILPSPPSANPGGLQSDTGDYYFCQSFTWWCNLILVTMAKCFNDLRTLATAGGDNADTLCGVTPPLIQFNPDNQTCSLSLPATFFNTYDQSVSPPVVNPDVVKLFSTLLSLDYLAVSQQNDTNITPRWGLHTRYW